MATSTCWYLLPFPNWICVSAEAWGSWAQGFFTVAAIFGAFAVARWQINRQCRIDRFLQREKCQQELQSVIKIITAITGEVMVMVRPVRRIGKIVEIDLKGVQARIEDMLEILDQVPYHEHPYIYLAIDCVRLNHSITNFFAKALKYVSLLDYMPEVDRAHPVIEEMMEAASHVIKIGRRIEHDGFSLAMQLIDAKLGI